MKIFKKILHYENYLVLFIIPLFWITLLTVLDHSRSYWFNYWWMFPIAFVIAITVNTVGISGAALFVPFFIIVFPLLSVPLLPEQSVKLGLITESFGLSSSALAFLRFGLVDKKLGFYTILGAAPFVIGGAILPFYLPKYLFNFLIAAALLISIILLSSKERQNSKLACIRHSKIGKHNPNYTDNVTLIDKSGKEYKYCRGHGRKKRFFGYGVGGVFQGMSGFGIGELGIMSMILTKIPIRVAIGTSHLIVATTAILASFVHVYQSVSFNIPTPWNIVFMTVPAVILGGQIAPYIAARLKTSNLEKIVSGLFILLAAILIYLGFVSLGF